MEEKRSVILSFVMASMLQRRLSVIGYFIVMLLWNVTGHAQEFDLPYTQFTKKDGLPSNLIYTQVFDKEGVLWIGSDAGLTRFDGSTSKTYTVADGLPSNDVVYLYVDRFNRIWVTMLKNEICYIYQDKVHTVKNNATLHAIGSNVKQARFYEDQFNNFWIIPFNKNLFRINPRGQVDLFPIPYGITVHIPYGDSLILHTFYSKYILDCKTLQYRYMKMDSNEVYSHAYPFKKNIYLINLSGEPKVITFQEFIHPISPRVTNCNFYNNLVDDKFNYIGTSNGMKVYNSTNSTFLKTLLSGRMISKITKDPSGYLWVGTHGDGLYRFSNRDINNYYSNTNLPFSAFHSIYKNENHLLIGDNKNGVQIFDSHTRKKIKSLQIKIHRNLGTRVSRITQSENYYYLSGDDFIGKITTDFQSLFFQQEMSKNLFFIDKYVINTSSGFLAFLKKNDLSESFNIITGKRMYSMCWYDGKYLVGSEDSLYFLTTEKDKYYLRNANLPFRYWCTDILAVDSSLVLATAEKGLFFYHHGKFTRNINVDNGLPSNNCRKLKLQYPYLYIATNNGVCRYDFVQNRANSLTESDGLPSNNVNDIDLDSTHLYAATESGAAIINLKEFDQHPNPTLFLKPIIYKEDTLWNTTKSIQVFQNTEAIFHLNNPDYSGYARPVYYYRIANQNTDFIRSTDPSLRINFSSAGKTQLEAYVQTIDGRKSGILIFPIEVTQHWYQTAWFYALIFILLILLLLALFKYYFERKSQRDQDDAKLEIKRRTIEMAEWKSAINPHFVYNSLNTMQGMFGDQEFERGNQYLAQFTRILRKSVQYSGRLNIEITEEVEFLHHYLELERLKRENFSYHIRLHNFDKQKLYIPTLVIQPILENSLKHGIQDVANGIIEVDFYCKEKSIHCHVQDNGLGTAQTLPKKESKGLKLIENKLLMFKKLTHQTIHFSYGNKLLPDGRVVGYETLFIFPLIFKDYDLTSRNR
jgi:hypothetical protein